MDRYRQHDHGSRAGRIARKLEDEDADYDSEDEHASGGPATSSMTTISWDDEDYAFAHDAMPPRCDGPHAETGSEPEHLRTDSLSRRTKTGEDLAQGTFSSRSPWRSSRSLATLAAGWSPKLGLDLAGGFEATYTPQHKVTSGEIQTVISILQNRIDGLGVSGALINSQGGNVVVQVPGLANRQQLSSTHPADRRDAVPAGALRGTCLHPAPRQGAPPPRPGLCPRRVLRSTSSRRPT